MGPVRAADPAERHVVLIGLPGAGKTTAGRTLAKVLERPFADADEQLELAVGSTIPRLFRERGEAELRRLEGKLLADLVSRSGPLVVSAAGATEIGGDLRERLASSAVVVWFRASARFLAELSDPTHRPRVADAQEAALTRLGRELSTVYGEVADHSVDIEPFHALGGRPKDAIVRHVVALLTAGEPRGAVRLPAAGPGEANGGAAGEAAGEVDGYAEALARAEAEASAHFADVADHIVDVEPFHALGGDAKRAIARHVVELLARHRGVSGPPGS